MKILRQDESHSARQLLKEFYHRQWTYLSTAGCTKGYRFTVLALNSRSDSF